MSALEALKRHSTVVVDSGDFEVIKAFSAQDATTNPSLILQASLDTKYSALVDQAIR